MQRLDPTNHVMCVFDDPAAAQRAVEALRAAGVASTDLELLAGPAGAPRIDAAGRRGGRWLRIKRLVALTQADQSVDLAMYEAALRDGRAVLAVHPGSADRGLIAETLRDAGAHFVNWYGLLMTQELVPWRGERLPLPPFLQR